MPSSIPFATPLLVLDGHQKILAASRSFYQTFQIASRDVRGHLLFEIENGKWGIPELRSLLEKLSRDHEAVEGYEVDRVFAGTPIEISGYLTKLCETLVQSMIGDSRPISLRVESDPGTVISHEADIPGG
jgi:hypothetical protein